MGYPRMSIPGLLLSIVAFGVGLGCKPPQVHLASMPIETPSSELAKTQSRTIPLPRGTAFAKALDVLMDMGFQIRCASQESGQLNIYKVWNDANQNGAQLSIEATLLFKSDGPESTQIRVSATGQWKVISVGGKNSASADVSGKAPAQDPSDYQVFLDRLIAGIYPPAK